MTQADLKIAISRLSIRINRELGGQAHCDKLELEMDKLQSQIEDTVFKKGRTNEQDPGPADDHLG